VFREVVREGSGKASFRLGQVSGTFRNFQELSRGQFRASFGPDPGFRNFQELLRGVREGVREGRVSGRVSGSGCKVKFRGKLYFGAVGACARILPKAIVSLRELQRDSLSR